MGQSDGSLEDHNAKRNENSEGLTPELQNREIILLGTVLVLPSGKESGFIIFIISVQDWQ